MRSKPVTPYERLLSQALAFLGEALWPRRTRMWTYGKDKLAAGASWQLGDLYQRVAAADQLGFDVVLVAADDGLVVQYRTRPRRPDSGPLAG